VKPNPKRLRELRHVALDMDGTIYSGGTLFKFTLPFLSELKNLGIGYTFLTNNSSKSTRDYLLHLKKFGIEATAEQLYTSTRATVEYIKERLPKISRLFVLGTESLTQELSEDGFTMVSDAPNDEPHAVLAGFDTALTFPRLCRAAWWIKQGKPYIATHPDRTCPTDEPTVLVDCGAVCAALQTATGRAPDAVLGKPDPRMLSGILRRHELAPHQLAMAGDRLYTDMAMAEKAGAFGVLVLTGETTASEVKETGAQLDLVVPSLKEFGELLLRARK
jgi:HAD superfamily hydrolase (TIGR01450 family)